MEIPEHKRRAILKELNPTEEEEEDEGQNNGDMAINAPY